MLRPYKAGRPVPEGGGRYKGQEKRAGLKTGHYNGDDGEGVGRGMRAM